MRNMKFVRGTVNEIKVYGKPLRVVIEELKMKLSQNLIIDGTIRCELEDKGDISNFTNELNKRVKLMEENLKQKFVLQAKDMNKWDEKPYDMIFERVRGCKEICPFCHEPCNQQLHITEGTILLISIARFVLVDGAIANLGK